MLPFPPDSTGTRRSRSAVAALVAVLLLTGCSATGGPVTDPGSAGTGVPTGPAPISRGPSTTSPTGSTGSTVTRPGPTTGTARTGPAASLGFAELSRRRADLTGRTVQVRGRVLFALRCPPPAGGAAPTCTALAFLTDPATTDLLPGQEQDAVQLLRAGTGISCPAHTTRDLACQGLRHGVVHDVTGTVTTSFHRVVLDVIRTDRAG